MRQAEGREVVIVEAVRTPIGRGHKEKGYYKDTHPNALLGKVYTEVIARAGIDANANGRRRRRLRLQRRLPAWFAGARGGRVARAAQRLRHRQHVV